MSICFGLLTCRAATAAGDEVIREPGQGLAVDAANHILAPAFHRDEVCIPQFLEVKAERRTDLFRPSYRTTDLSDSRTRDVPNFAFFAHCHGAAAGAKKFENSQTSRVP